MNKKVIVNRKKTGQQISRLIIEKGLTVEKIAELLELKSGRVIYEWMRGAKQPSLENAYSLSIIFDTKLDEIICFELASSNTKE